MSRCIHEAASYGIVLIVAAPGYGKSSALHDAYDSESAIFIELQQGNATVEAFFKALVAKAVPRYSQSLAMLVEKTPADTLVETVIPWLSARLRGVEKAIVVDDLHHLFSDERATSALQLLVDATHHALTWIFSSRETPEFPVGTWIAHEWMRRPITGGDLAYRDDEAIELAKALGIGISRSDVAAFVEITGGWPIALRLHLTNWDPLRPTLPAEMRTREVLFRYLEEQLWSRVEPDDRAFLECAVVLPQPALSVMREAGFPDAGSAFERLSRRITLIERDEAGDFRLHPMLREFIVERQRLDGPRFDAVVASAARALAKLGLIADALRLYAGLKAEDDVLRILASAGFNLIESGEKSAVRSALSALSGKRREDPVACGLRGYLLSLDGAFASAEAEMLQGTNSGLWGPFYTALARRLAMFYVNRVRYAEAVALFEAVLARVRAGSSEALEVHADLAATRGSAGDAVGAMNHAGIALDGIANVPLAGRAQLLGRVAAAYFYARNHVQAEAIANEAVALATQLGFDNLASRVYSLLYAIAEETHQDPTRAEFYARAMGLAAENAGDRQLRAASLERLLQTATYRGDDELIAATEQQLTSLGHIRTYRDTIEGRMTRVVCEVGRANFRQARRLLEGANVTELSAAEIGVRTALLCCCLIADGASDQAATLLEKPFLIELEVDLYSRRYVAIAQAYRAMANWMLGRRAVARRVVAGDDTAMTEGLRVFLEAIASVCGTKRSTVSERVVHQLTEPLVALNFGGQARFIRSLAAVGYRPAQLTRAELELLRSWRVGDTIVELADRIGKSPHTVNTQMRSICRKTGTSGRAEAISYAEKHGFL